MSQRAAPFDLDAWLRQWRGWLTAITDRVFELDERTHAGTPGEQADVAAAFVARKSIGDRLDAVAATMGRDRAGATTLANQPLVDDNGGPVGRDLDDAARLLEAILDKVDKQVSAREAVEQRDAQLRATLSGDLAVAERLAGELGERVNHVAELRKAADAGRDLAATAAEATKVRVDLQRAATDRDRVVARWDGLDAELEQLAGEETAVRQLADRCREKIANPPPIAVPSVAVVSARERNIDLKSMPWPAARTKAVPVVEQVDRLKAALAEARRRFEEALARRDDLRGLLQAFREKAAAHGVGEHPNVEGPYREAERVLWSAPCDLALAGRLVEQFVAVVNSMTGVAR